ncbi:22085_t:CDS:1, partial [Dentiscutata erythropus]
ENNLSTEAEFVEIENILRAIKANSGAIPDTPSQKSKTDSYC